MFDLGVIIHTIVCLFSVAGREMDFTVKMVIYTIDILLLVLASSCLKMDKNTILLFVICSPDPKLVLFGVKTATLVAMLVRRWFVLIVEWLA